MLSDVLRQGAPVLLALAVVIMQPATQSAANAVTTESDSGKTTSKAINPGEVRIASRTRSMGTTSSKENSRSVSKQSGGKQSVGRVKRSSSTGKKLSTTKLKGTKKAGGTNNGNTGKTGTAASTKTGTGTNSTSGNSGKIGTGPGKTGSGVSGTGTNSTNGTNGKIGTGPGKIGSGANTLTSTRAQINPNAAPTQVCDVSGCKKPGDLPRAPQINGIPSTFVTPAGVTKTTDKNTGLTTVTDKNTGVTTTTNAKTGVTKTTTDIGSPVLVPTTIKHTGVPTTTDKATGVTTTTDKNGVTTTTKGGGGGTTTAGGGTATAGGGKTSQGGIGPVAGVMGGMSGNSTPINNQSVTIFRGPRAVWFGGEERFFVAASVLPGLYLGSDYYAPQGYIAVAQPACYGRTAEGCLLRWRQVPLESGGSDVQCVQLCRSGGVAQAPPAQSTAAVAQAFASEPMAPAPAQAQTAGGCEVAIYADANFAGQATATVENQPRLGDVGWKGEIASVRVKGGTWDFFSDDDYGGQTMRLPPGEYAQFGPPWTKQISSFMCLGQQ